MSSNKSLHDLLQQDTISNGDVRYMSDSVKAEIIEKTKNCLGSIRERLFWLQHNLKNYPTCSTCFNLLLSKNFRLSGKGGWYTQTCSVKCAKRNPVFAEKQKQSNLEKYGNQYYLGSADARIKISSTNLEKYGSIVHAPWGSDEFKQSMIKKYNVDSALKSTEIKNKIIKNIIENNVLSGKTESSIIACQAMRNVECVNAELALDTNRDILENVNLEWKHKACGKNYISAINDGQIRSCPHCHNNASVLELSLRNLIVSLLDNNEDVQFNCKNILPGNFELDIFIPSKNIAFEFNGIYWHSTVRDKNKYKHLNKTELCESKGIRLIHIWEHHFLQNYDIVKSVIANALGKSKKIAARKCVVKQIESKIANLFLVKNHLNGFIRTKTNLGMYYNDELVAVMTFGKKRFNKNVTSDDWEIFRFCTLAGYQIQGGASKLFSFFKNNFNPNSVVSFADKSLGGGDAYLKMGLTEEQSTAPAYFWANRSSSVQLSRFKTQKHKLKELLGDKFDENLSEDSNMKKNGWFKIYDCGNRKFSWIKSV